MWVFTCLPWTKKFAKTDSCPLYHSRGLEASLFFKINVSPLMSHLEKKLLWPDNDHNLKSINLTSVELSPNRGYQRAKALLCMLFCFYRRMSFLLTQTALMNYLVLQFYKTWRVTINTLKKVELEQQRPKANPVSQNNSHNVFWSFVW